MNGDDGDGDHGHVILDAREGLSDSPWTAELAFETYRPHVEKVVELGVENTCAAPLLWVGFKDELIEQELLAEVHPMDQLRALAWSVYTNALPAPDWIVFMTEGYSTTSDDVSQLAGVERGELQARHQIGMAGVDEGVWGHMAHRSGSRWLASQAYERDDDGRSLHWQELYEASKGGGKTMRLLLTIVGRFELAAQVSWPS